MHISILDYVANLVRRTLITQILMDSEQRKIYDKRGPEEASEHLYGGKDGIFDEVCQAHFRGFHVFVPIFGTWRMPGTIMYANSYDTSAC